MVDLDKLVCSLLEVLQHTRHLREAFNNIVYALKDQGLEYKDGNLHYIGEEKKPDTIKFEEEKPQTFEDISKNGGIDMSRPITIPKPDSFWTDKEIEQLEKETDEGTDKLEKDLRKILFAKKPDFDKMVEEYSDSLSIVPSMTKDIKLYHYRQGLEDMYKRLKGE